MNRSTTAAMPAEDIDLKQVADGVSIVVPAFNEEYGIGPTLESLLAELPGAEIIVVDDGSSDRTAEVVMRFPQVTLVQHPFNRGYGAALKTGMTVASRELVAWFDADNEHRVEDLVAMVRRALGEQVAAVIAQRATPGVSPLRSWGKAVIRSLARSLSAEAGHDINCGLRVFRREVITRYLQLLPDSFSASITSTIIMLERGYPVAYQQVGLNKRIGRSKVKISDGFLALMMVLRIIMLFAPMRIFLRAGMIMFGVGLLLSVVVALWLGRGLPASGLALMLVGALVAFAGLIADQISQMRLSAYDQPLYRIKQRPSASPSAKSEVT